MTPVKIDLEKYRNKRLTTNKLAIVLNEITKLTNDLESFNYKKGEDYILFESGTIAKVYLTSEKGKKLVKQYASLYSRDKSKKPGDNQYNMALPFVFRYPSTQHDTPKQKQLICQMIDECDGTLQNYCDGKYYTKREAKKYILANK